MFIRRFNYIFILIAIVGLVIDIFFIKYFYDILYLALIVGWIIVIRHFKVRTNLLLIFGLCCLSLMLVFLIFSGENIGEKFALWAYIFLTLAFARSLREKI